MELKFKWVLSLSFEDVPPPVSFYQIPKLSVSSNGVMTMNQPLQKALDCACPIHMQISEDGRVIKLTSVENGDQHFSSKGQLKNSKLLSMLQRKGVQLPCRYLMDWDSDEEVWIGCSEDLPAPPDMEMPPRKRKRKAL